MSVPEGDAPSASVEVVRRGSDLPAVPGSFDAAIGAAAVAGGAVAAVARGVGRLARPVGEVVLHPPLVPEALHPARVVDSLVDRGRETRATVELDPIVMAVVPVVVREVLDALDLNAIIRERVDLDGLVATVDVADVIARVDVNAIVDQVDIDAIVQRVDIDQIVARIDLDAIADRIDIERILTRVDVDAIVASVDLDAIIDRLDVAGIAEGVINDIDLPEIIRDSTGSVASQVVRDARVQSIEADEAISRIADRLLLRRRARRTAAAAASGAASDAADVAEQTDADGEDR